MGSVISSYFEALESHPFQIISLTSMVSYAISEAVLTNSTSGNYFILSSFISISFCFIFC